MASIINATTTGLTVTPDNSGQLTLSANGVTALTANTTGYCTFTNDFASVAGYPAYQCRAWVNFNGTSTVAIRGSGNVTSITDNGTGDYTVNFTTAMPDINYAQMLIHSPSYGAAFPTPAFNSNTSVLTEVAPTTTTARFACAISLSTYFDPKYVSFAIFR